MKAVPPDESDRVAVQAVMLAAEAPVRTAPEADVLQAFQQMVQAERDRLLVFEGETFRGLPTQTGVARLIELKMALER